MWCVASEEDTSSRKVYGTSSKLQTPFFTPKREVERETVCLPAAGSRQEEEKQGGGRNLLLEY